MNPAVLLAVIGGVGGVLGALLTYFNVKRKQSGKINTSEAKDLWTEAQSMRDDYRARLLSAEVRIGVLESQLATVAAERDKLVDALIAANQKAADVAVETARLAAAVATATAETARKATESEVPH